MLGDLEKRGLAVEDQGAIVVHVAEEGDGKRPLPPLILEKRDGAATYATTDLATILQRVAEKPPAERILYVVDQRQGDHFAQVFRAARKAGVTARLEHVGFGTVNGRDGKALKTRAGGTVKLAELLDEAVATALARLEASEQGKELEPDERRTLARQIGIGAVKFADLASNRVSGYVFDAERLVSFEGKTGPYLQYACVRLARIVAKAREQGKSAGPIAPEHAAERALVLDCLRLPDVVASAANSLLPSEIAEYAFGLAQKLSRFYTECPVLQEENAGVRGSRIAMCQLAHAVLSRCLWLLGIGVPDKM
jgi:arginyl-tRNA synthetase